MVTQKLHKVLSQCLCTSWSPEARDLRPEDIVKSEAKESCIRLVKWAQPSGWTSNGDIEAEALIEVVVSE